MTKTRAHRAPLSIWIMVAAWAFLVLQPMVSWAMTVPSADRGRIALPGILALGLVIYHTVALARLSRWPILLLSAVICGSGLTGAMSVYRGHFAWTTIAFMVTPIAVVLIIYLACTLPHWRKMNWALFGRPYRPTAELEEVFA